MKKLQLPQEVAEPTKSGIGVVRCGRCYAVLPDDLYHIPASPSEQLFELGRSWYGCAACF